MKEQKGYINRNGLVVGSQPQKSKGFKKIGFLDYPLDIHITATEEQLKNGRVTIIVNRKINNELYETVIPNVRVDEFPIQFIEDEENEALDFIIAQEEIALQKARENVVKSVRKSRRNQPAENQNQQREIAEMKDFIERFRYKPTKAVQVQNRIKQLAKIVPIEVDEVDNSALHLKFPPCSRSGDYPVICEELTKFYGDHCVLRNVNLTIKRGEKVAFVGRNGEGKSTWVKCLMGETDFKGTLKLGHGVEIGYYAQNQAQLLDGELTVFDTIDRVATGDIRTKIRDILGAFMFGGEASDKKVKVLSGGERSRLAMIRLLLEPVNFLILDEPTNHLDIRYITIYTFISIVRRSKYTFFAFVHI